MNGKGQTASHHDHKHREKGGLRFVLEACRQTDSPSSWSGSGGKATPAYVRRQEVAVRISIAQVQPPVLLG
jgi:hypothetical protein